MGRTHTWLTGLLLLMGCPDTEPQWPAKAGPPSILNLNVFDEQQSKWPKDFREGRIKALSRFVADKDPYILVFQEFCGGDTDKAKDGSGNLPDAARFAESYPHRNYVHEITGKANQSYGYAILSKTKPKKVLKDGFRFEGGVDRKVQAAVFDDAAGKCFGILNVHLSHQNSTVRQKEAMWLLRWLKDHERDCARWYVMGDFNADETSKEYEMLTTGGLTALSKPVVPTVGPFNPLRRISGGVKDKQIDWVFGYNAQGSASVVLNKAQWGVWVSDHAALLLTLPR